MRNSIFLILIFLVLISGCGQASMMSAMTSHGDEQNAKTYIDLLRAHKFDQIENALDPSIKSANTHDLLVHMASAIPAQDPISTKVVGSNTFNSPHVYKSNITFEYQYPDQWLLINVAVAKQDDVSTIVGFNVKPLNDSIESMNKFTLAGKSLLQYTVLGAAVVAALFSLFALIVCIRTKIPTRKWLWIVFILFGVGGFAVNWTTGQWHITPIYVQLFSAAAFAPFYGAWTISVSLPLGAIWFLLKRKEFSAVVAGTSDQVES
jgi:hypothetical protein